jgi:hypothetical protein
MTNILKIAILEILINYFPFIKCQIFHVKSHKFPQIGSKVNLLVGIYPRDFEIHEIIGSRRIIYICERFLSFHNFTLIVKESLNEGIIIFEFVDFFVKDFGQ